MVKFCLKIFGLLVCTLCICLLNYKISGICLNVYDHRISVEKLTTSVKSHLPVGDHPFFSNFNLLA